MLAELQGRLPIRVELKPLTEKANLAPRLRRDCGEVAGPRLRGRGGAKVVPRGSAVALRGLHDAAQDMYTILTEPENNLCKQQEALMFTEGVHLEITDDAKW